MFHSNRLRTAFWILSAGLLLGGSPAAMAQSASSEGARREAAEMRLEEFKQRLALTPEQESRLAPLIEARNARLRELRASKGSDTSRRARISTLKQARQIQEEFNAQVTPILTPEQQAEWQKIREEVKAAARERLRERR